MAGVINSDEVMLEQAGPSPGETGVLPKRGFGHRHTLGESHVKMKVDFGVKGPHAKEHQGWASEAPEASRECAADAPRSLGGGRGADEGWDRPAEDRFCFFTNLPICLENEAFLTGLAGHPDLR